VKRRSFRVVLTLWPATGCIFETGRRRTAAEGARTRSGPFASKNGVTLKISQNSEMSVYSDGESHGNFFSPVW